MTLARDLDEIADKVGTVGIEEIITEVTSRLCYFLKTRAIQGVPFGYPDYIEVGAIHVQRQLRRSVVVGSGVLQLAILPFRARLLHRRQALQL